MSGLDRSIVAQEQGNYLRYRVGNGHCQVLFAVRKVGDQRALNPIVQQDFGDYCTGRFVAGDQYQLILQVRAGLSAD